MNDRFLGFTNCGCGGGLGRDKLVEPIAGVEPSATERNGPGTFCHCWGNVFLLTGLLPGVDCFFFGLVGVSSSTVKTPSLSMRVSILVRFLRSILTVSVRVEPVGA